MGEALVGQGNLTRMQVEVEAGEDAHQGWNGDEAVGNTGLEKREMQMVNQYAHVHPACVSKETHEAYSLFSPTRTHKHTIILVLMSPEKLGKEKGAK